MRKRLVAAGLLAVLAAVGAFAQVRVTKGAGQKSAMDLTAFSAGSGAAAVFRKTLEEDLVRSGWFIPVAAGRGEFRLEGDSSDDGADVRAACRLYDTATRRSYLSKSYRTVRTDARRLAHQVADDIIRAVTGRPGLLSTRLVVVGNRTGRKELYLCDSDGHNLVQLTKDRSISLAPKWGPDGDRLVYTSYLKGYPDLYLIDLPTGNRQRVSSSPGLNTGGDISPSGREMALILSKDGNPELYIMNLRTRALTRVTTTPRAAEANPTWSPDGKRICYVSDQSGTPQLYIVSRDGGRPSRLTARGSENVAPDWGANGWIAYTSRTGGRYQVWMANPDTMEFRQVTADDADYEDPAWAPDGRHLACGRTRQRRSSIYLLDTAGDAPIALLDAEGNWFSPAWSPK